MKGFSTPQEFLNNLTWYGKTKSYRRGCEFDVSVTISKQGVNVTFRNDTYKYFKSGTVKISITEDSVFFMDGGKDGMKLTTVHNPNSRCAKFYNKQVIDLLRTFTGDYELRYFKAVGLHYITKGEE